MTKMYNFALKIKGGGREGDRYEVLRLCHPPKIWNVHQHVSSGFPPKKRPGTRAITNSGQLQNNCPLFV